MPASRYRRNMTTESRGPSSFVRSGLSWADADHLAYWWNVGAESDGASHRYVVVDRFAYGEGYAVQRREVA